MVDVFIIMEKVRYKWRRRKTLVRFIVSALDVIWRTWTATPNLEKSKLILAAMRWVS